jgi:hypothetical protein
MDCCNQVNHDWNKQFLFSLLLWFLVLSPRCIHFVPFHCLVRRSSGVSLQNSLISPYFVAFNQYDCTCIIILLSSLLPVLLLLLFLPFSPHTHTSISIPNLPSIHRMVIHCLIRSTRSTCLHTLRVPSHGGIGLLL